MKRPNDGVDAAARIHSTFAAPSKLRNTLPPLASNDLLGTPLRKSRLPAQGMFQKISEANNVVRMFEATLRNCMENRFG